MKKSFLMIAMVAMAFASCKKEATPSVSVLDTVPPQEEGALVPVSFSVGTPSVEVKSKAVGTVGGLADDNVWNGETIYVYGVEKATEANYANVVCMIDNQAIETTVGTVADTYTPPAPDGPRPETPYYYDPAKVYSFYGYYLDDAQATDPVKVTAGINRTVTITGQQDLMVAKATPADDVNGQTDIEKYAYSAYTARRSVIPNLKFNHLLTRFTFKIQAAAESAYDLYVTGLTLESKSQVVMTVAGAQGLSDWQTPAEFSLMQRTSATDRTLIALEERTFEQPAHTPENPETFVLGESLLVAPGEASYTFELGLRHKDDGELDPITATIPASAVAEGLTAFEAGKSYEVTIKLVGPEAVKVSATLSQWVSGGSWTLDTDTPPVVE